MGELGLSSPFLILMAEFEPALAPALPVAPAPVSRTDNVDYPGLLGFSVHSKAHEGPTPLQPHFFLFRSFPFSVVRGQQPPWELAKAGDRVEG